MINGRLIEYLEMRKVIVNIHCGCSQNRNTLDLLVSLEQEISNFLGERGI